VRSTYDRILDQVRGRYGDQITSDADLRSMLEYYKISPYVVGSKTDFNTLADKPKPIAHGIFNTDPAPPGTHWFAVYDGYVYDPLGDDQSRTQEQPDEADDCGQRCVAYLLMCKRLKRGAIKF